MPHSDGSARAEASPGCLPPPPPRPPRVFPPLLPGPRPRLRRSSSPATPLNRHACPPCSSHSPGPDPGRRPNPRSARRTRATPTPTPQAPRPRAGEGRGARRGLIHMQQGTARRGGRQEGTKAVPPPAAQCQARPAPPPRWPPRRPPLRLSRRPGCIVRTASGRRRQPPSDPASPTSSCDPRGHSPFSVSPGQLRWPRLLN